MTQSTIQASDTHNLSGSKAYKLSSKQELAQLAVTGFFNNSYYTSAESQLERVLTLAKEVEPEFLAKLIVYSREQGYMKDMPAALCALLSTISPQLLDRIFPRVINNGKMLGNFVQIVRSGQLGRKSLGSAPRRLVRSWFESRTDQTVLFNSIGSNPSMADMISLAHPRPMSKERAALYGWFLGKSEGRFNDEKFPVADALPALVKEYEDFKKNPSATLPRVPMEMLEGLPLTDEAWKEIAARASWSQTRQGLNKFARHGVFNDPALTKVIVDRLRSPEEVKKAKVFPYQLLSTYLHTEGSGLPAEVIKALEDAMEVSVDNVPVIEGNLYVFPDCSGSMCSAPVTGARSKDPKRGPPSSKVHAVHVAGLVAACLLRRNPQAQILPFEGTVREVKVNPNASILENARVLASLQGGATHCEAPLQLLNSRNAKMDVGVYVSDYESNIGSVTTSASYGYFAGHERGSRTLVEFDKLKQRCPEAKLVCIDTAPHGTVQAPNRGDILNVGGFSDKVFDVVGTFLKGGSETEWLDTIEKIEI